MWVQTRASLSGVETNTTSEEQSFSINPVGVQAAEEEEIPFGKVSQSKDTFGEFISEKFLRWRLWLDTNTDLSLSNTVVTPQKEKKHPVTSVS